MFDMMSNDSAAGKAPSSLSSPPDQHVVDTRVMREPAPTREDHHRHAAAMRDRAATLKAMVIHPRWRMLPQHARVNDKLVGRR